MKTTLVVALAFALAATSAYAQTNDQCTCIHDILCYKSLADCDSQTDPLVPSPHTNASFSACVGINRGFYACWETPTVCHTTASCNPQPKCQCKKDIKCFKTLSDCLNQNGAVTPEVTNSNQDCLDIGDPYYSCWEDPSVCYVTATCEPVTPGGGSQDPHFVGFDGTDYYFEGDAGKDYNIVSDAKMQLNARFVRLTKLKGTYMGQIAILFGQYSLTFDPSFGAFFNGSLVSSAEFELADAAFAVDTTADGKPRLVFTDDSWHVVATSAVESGAKDEAYVNLRVSVISDVTNPHGILGQTAGRAIPGPIEGKESDYEVKDGILGTDFAYNRFQVAADEQPITAVGVRLRREVKPRFEAASA